MFPRGTSGSQPQPANTNPFRTAIISNTSGDAPLVKNQTQVQLQGIHNWQRRPSSIIHTPGEDNLVYEYRTHMPSDESVREIPQRNPFLPYMQEPPQHNSKNPVSDICSMNLSLSAGEDFKLHEAEYPWRPARFTKNESAADGDKKTEQIYSKVRGVLNKLTPQKFEILLSQIKVLQIDTESRLQGVVDLVFEKAVDEPIYSTLYALLCAELALMRVPTQNSTAEKPVEVNLRKLIVNRCQIEFEKAFYDDSIRTAKVKEIEECTDPEQKKNLQFELEEYDRKLRMKSVGNIRFIGELFKQNMLTVNIMMKCLKNLSNNKDEESLEGLCTLLTTIGKELEFKNVDLSSVFSTMKNIAEKRDGNVSGRIRCMLHGVIDLKNSKWVPRRPGHNPKTIDQILKETDQEQYMMHFAAMSLRSDVCVGNIGSGQNPFDQKRNGGNKNNPSNPKEWRTRNRQMNQINIRRDKLKNKTPPQPNSNKKIIAKKKEPLMKPPPTLMKNADDEYQKIEEFYNKVRGILDTLTPLRSETILSQIKGLQIDTQCRLQCVTYLVHEKAVDEPHLSGTCAFICSELALMQVPTPSSTPEKPEVVNFRKLLANRCQVEFEKHSHDESVRLAKVKEIKECTDPERKIYLQFELEEYDRKLRIKYIGNIRFIGELFKQNMLTVNILMRCLKNLLDNKDEDSLECLCILLTTVGKELESINVDLTDIFSAMKNIYKKRVRIQGMLEEVINMKNFNWVPKRQEEAVGQIQNEAEQGSITMPCLLL